MDERKPLMKYYYTAIGAGMLTVAYTASVENVKSDKTEVRVKFGYAFCEPNDSFSKKDIVKKITKSTYNKETGKSETVVVKEVVVPGGRTIALRRYNESPAEMIVNVDTANPQHTPSEQIITCILDHCWNIAPKWKKKSHHYVSKDGTHVLSRDGYKLFWASPKRETLIYLETPFGSESA